MSEIKVDTVAEKTSANGVTVDGLNIKDSKLVTANSVITSNITDANITTAKIADVNVTEGKIADNAITLAKMASGTDGNIISYDASGNPVAIATGNDGQVLTSTGAGSPPAFEAIPAGGKIGQVVSAAKIDTQATTANNAWSDVSGLSVAITPSATSSKILVLFNVNISPNTNNHAGIKLVRASTDVFEGNSGSGTRDCFSAIRHMSDDQYHISNMAGQFLDSPSTSSAVTYKIMANGNADYYINTSLTESGATSIQRPRGASSITLMEVLA
jgi:hypothetical protein